MHVIINQHSCQDVCAEAIAYLEQLVKAVLSFPVCCFTFKVLMLLNIIIWSCLAFYQGFEIGCRDETGMKNIATCFTCTFGRMETTDMMTQRIRLKLMKNLCSVQLSGLV